MNIKRSTRIRALIGSVVIGGVLALSAGPASARVPLSGGGLQTPGVKSGDTCRGWYSTGTYLAPGTKGCLERTERTWGKSMSFQIHAVDTKGDGHSARTEVMVSQPIRNGYGVYLPTMAVTNSSGRGTSRVGPNIKVTRAPGADRYMISIRTCTYESGPGTYVACGSWTYDFYDWEYEELVIL